MSKWGWKQSAMFVVGLACATGVLVGAGLAEASSAPDPSAVSETGAR
jgi:hypothetical protein